MAGNEKVPGRGLPPGVPRWVKVFVIGVIAMIALVVALHLLGFGFGSHSAGGEILAIAIRMTLSSGSARQ